MCACTCRPARVRTRAGDYPKLLPIGPRRCGRPASAAFCAYVALLPEGALVRALCALALCLPYCSRSVRVCLCVRAHTKATSCRGRVRARSLRALCSEGALCTGALCAGAVPAVLFSERSIVFMCARAHKGHIVPLVVFVLAACEHGPRPASWLCSCSRGVRAQATPAY